MKQKIPRGIRNNNPLNIRKNATRWKGLKPVQEDKAFFQFVAPEWGYRAAIRTLQTYKNKHGLKTIQDFICRWAPPEDGGNDTGRYIGAVCGRTNIPRSVEIDVYDKEIMCRIIGAMSYVENGIPAKIEDVEKGWELL